MEQKQSGLGIASFILSILSGLLIFVMFIIAGVLEASSPGGIDERSAGAVVLGLFIIGLLALDLVALGLGIGALCQKDRKRLFAVLGTVFAALTIVGTIVLIVIGNSM